jgi:predicted PurR-regulated permease PerM
MSLAQMRSTYGFVRLTGGRILRRSTAMASDPAAPIQPNSQQRARLVLALGFVLVGLWILHDFLPALAWAVVLSIAIWPLYRRVQLLWPGRVGRIVVPLLVTFAVGIVFAAPLILLGVAIAHEMRLLFPLLREARQHGIEMPGFVLDIPIVGSSIAEWWNANLADPATAQDLLGRVNPRMLAESAREYGGEVVRRFVTFLFTLLTLFFLFREGGSLGDELLALSDRVLGQRGETIGRHMVAAVHGTVVGLVLVGLAEGIILGIVYIAVGLPYPASVGAATSVLAVIPFGAPLIYTVAALYMFSTGQTLAAIIIFAAGSVVVFIADHFIRPALIGGSARLPFLWVLLGLLGGLETLGFIGLFLGPAIMAALIALWREWTESPAAEGTSPSPPARPASDGRRRGRGP